MAWLGHLVAYNHPTFFGHPVFSFSGYWRVIGAMSAGQIGIGSRLRLPKQLLPPLAVLSGRCDTIYSPSVRQSRNGRRPVRRSRMSRWPLVAVVCTLGGFNVLIAPTPQAGAIAPPAEDPVPELVKALGDETALVRKRAAVALQRLGPAARPAVAALQKALMDDDADVRAAAAAALRTIGGPLSRDELLTQLRDKQQPAVVRTAACKELAERFPQDPVVVKAMEALLTDAAVKVEVARALDTMEGRPLPRKVTLEITLKGHGSPITALVFTPDGKTLVSGSGEPGK